MTLKEEQIFISQVNSFVQKLVRNGNGVLQALHQYAGAYYLNREGVRNLNFMVDKSGQ